MIRKAQFSHDGRNLEVQAAVEENEVTVRVFESGRPVTSATYSVTIETTFDAKMSGLPLDLVDELMQLAETDVTKGLVPLLPSQ